MDRKEYMRQYHIKHRERRLTTMKLHYQQNREHRLQQSHEYYKKTKPERQKYAKEYFQKYYPEHKETLIQTTLKWSEENPERRKELTHRYNKNNKEKINADCREYYKTHKNEAAEAKRRYRARKMNADGNFTEEEWIVLKEFFNFTCLCCSKQEPEIKLTRDHVIPLIRGGSDSIDNIQPLCEDCNRSKYTTVIDFRGG